MESNQSLDGIKVIDCSQILAGPFCSMLLADHGADVIKIEKPNGGDDVRTWGPPFIGKDSSAFVQLNRNKRSISLDIKSQEGKIILNKLMDTMPHLPYISKNMYTGHHNPKEESDSNHIPNNLPDI